MSVRVAFAAVAEIETSNHNLLLVQHPNNCSMVPRQTNADVSCCSTRCCTCTWNDTSKPSINAVHPSQMVYELRLVGHCNVWVASVTFQTRGTKANGNNMPNTLGVHTFSCLPKITLRTSHQTLILTSQIPHHCLSGYSN